MFARVSQLSLNFQIDNLCASAVLLRQCNEAVVMYFLLIPLLYCENLLQVASIYLRVSQLISLAHQVMQSRQEQWMVTLTHCFQVAKAAVRPPAKLMLGGD